MIFYRSWYRIKCTPHFNWASNPDEVDYHAYFCFVSKKEAARNFSTKKDE